MNSLLLQSSVLAYFDQEYAERKYLEEYKKDFTA